MAETFQYVDIGSAPNAKDGDTARAAFKKVNDNFKILYDAVASQVEEKSGNWLAVAQRIYVVDTSENPVTAQLPANPTVGMMIRFIDEKGAFSVNNLTVASNGSRINGQVISSKVHNENFTYVDYFYAGDTAGWITH